MASSYSCLLDRIIVCFIYLCLHLFLPSKSLHSLCSYSISILERRYCYDLAFPLLYRVSDSLLIASSHTIQSATKVPCDAEGHGLRVCTLFVYLTCIVFPPSGHSTLPIVSLTWPLSFSVYFPSFSLLSDSLYFRPATFPPPALVSDSRSIFRHVLTLRCTVYRHMYLAYSGLTFKSILLIVISHYDITRSPC